MPSENDPRNQPYSTVWKTRSGERTKVHEADGVMCVVTYVACAVKAMETAEPKQWWRSGFTSALPIVVPCHRVVGARGMGGFAGTTTGRWMHIKERLLRHEGVTPPC